MKSTQFREDLIALAIGVVMIGFALYTVISAVTP